MNPRTLPKHTRPVALATVATLAALGLAACGGSSGNSYSSKPATTKTTAATSTPAATPTPATSSSAGSKATITLAAAADGSLMFDKTSLNAKAGTVTVDMKNPASSGIPHAIAIEGNGVDKDGKTVQPGCTSTVTLKLKPGTYSFYCPVPGHKDAGMKGTLVVS